MKCSWIFLLLLSIHCPAQEITIAGYLTDIESSEALVNGHVYLGDQPHVGVTTNAYGFFSIQVPTGKIRLKASYVGYSTFERTYLLVRDTFLHIGLNPSSDIAEVTVVSKAGNRSKLESAMSIAPAMIKYLPTIGGERDIIRAMQLLPGIQSATEGTTGLVVRGGSPDQNLFLIDGCPIYNISHLYGFLSVFNDDAIKSAEIIKSGFPAQYGDRLSSIMNIYMKEGNLNKYEGSASIGLISSRVSLNGPIIKGKSSFNFSARRSYFDLITSIPLLFKDANSQIRKTGYSLSDLNAKINYLISNKDRVYFSLYYGGDLYKETYEDSGKRDSIRNDQQNSLNWGNFLSSLRWNHLFSDKLFCNTQISFTQYFLSGLNRYFSEDLTAPESQISGYNYHYLSKISDYSAKIDFNYNLNSLHQIKFGLHSGINIFKPGVESYQITLNQERQDNISTVNAFHSNSVAIYLEDKIFFPNGFYLHPGLRLGLLNSRSNKYYSVEPRFTGGYLWPNKASLSISYSRMQQPIHLLSNSGLGMPTDLWVPSTDRVPPEQSQQVSIGMNLPVGSFNLGFDGYYKQMKNLISYAEGASFLVSGNNWENKIELGGKGQAYGFELLIKKDIGKIKGWFGYTLSWSKRQFENINNGKWYFAKYDRRHDLSLNLTYHPKSNIFLSCTWVFSTGNPITLPEVIYPYIHYPIGLNDFNYIQTSENLFQFVTEMPRRRGEIVYYGERNKYRMPNYHRLDLAINILKQKKKFERTWSLGLYNVYSHRNPFYVTYADDTSGAWPIENAAGLKIVTLLPIMPSVSYSLKF